jgi:RNA polymerase sigma factor (sigma-70 family)
MVLKEENTSWPRQELSLNPTLLDTLNATTMQKSCDGKWRQPESLHQYDSSSDLPEPLCILIERIHREISQLPKRERRVLRLYYFKGYSQEDIATRVHCCRRRVGQLLDQSIAQIRRNILND